MMKPLLALLLIACGACAPKAITVSPLAPAVVRAGEQAKAASAGAKRTQAAATTVHAQAKGIASIANQMVVESERLKAIPGIPPGEFDVMWTLVTKNAQEVFAHEIHTGAGVVVADEGVTLTTAAEATTAELVPLAEKSDAAVVMLNNKVISQQDDVDFANAVRAWLWMAGIAAVLIIAGYLYLKFRPGLPL